ncbi:MAG: glycosyltransferase [Gemmatimonadota bacterium]
MILPGIIALLLVVLAWGLYPIGLRAFGRPPRIHAEGGPVEAVSVVIATRDDPEQVARRVENLEASDFPPGQLEIVVAVDPTAAWSTHDYRSSLGEQVIVVPGDPPGGKAATLNAGVRAATRPLVIFADTGQRFAPDALLRLAQRLAEPGVGAVSGGYETQQRAGRVADSLWRLEQFIRRGEASVHSIVAVTGAIYGMRRSLWKPLPAGAICDDLFVPFNVVFQGERVDYCEEALAVDPRHFTRAQDFRRKVRTLTGMIQFCLWMPRVLLPWRNPVWIQFLCHKLLRLATPFLMLVAVASLGPLLWRWVQPLALPVLGAAGAALVLLAVLRPRAIVRLSREAGWALLLLAAPLTASYRAVRGRWTWS